MLRVMAYPSWPTANGRTPRLRPLMPTHIEMEQLMKALVKNARNSAEARVAYIISSRATLNAGSLRSSRIVARA